MLITQTPSEVSHEIIDDQISEQDQYLLPLVDPDSLEPIFNYVAALLIQSRLLIKIQPLKYITQFFTVWQICQGQFLRPQPLLWQMPQLNMV